MAPITTGPAVRASLHRGPPSSSPAAQQPCSIAELVAGRPNAAYTTALVDQHMQLVDWEMHEQRLAE